MYIIRVGTSLCHCVLQTACAAASSAALAAVRAELEREKSRAAQLLQELNEVQLSALSLSLPSPLF